MFVLFRLSLCLLHIFVAIHALGLLYCLDLAACLEAVVGSVHQFVSG